MYPPFRSSSRSTGPLRSVIPCAARSLGALVSGGGDSREQAYSAVAARVRRKRKYTPAWLDSKRGWLGGSTAKASEAAQSSASPQLGRPTSHGQPASPGTHSSYPQAFCSGASLLRSTCVVDRVGESGGPILKWQQPNRLTNPGPGSDLPNLPPPEPTSAVRRDVSGARGNAACRPSLKRCDLGGLFWRGVRLDVVQCRTMRTSWEHH
jgi:hypothetical protein